MITDRFVSGMLPVSAGTIEISSGVIRATSARPASSRTTRSVAVTARPLKTQNGVTIIGAKNLPSKLAPASSLLYAKNLMNFVMLLVDKEAKGFKINEEDDLVKGSLITKDGKVVHPSLQNS